MVSSFFQYNNFSCYFLVQQTFIKCLPMCQLLILVLGRSCILKVVSPFIKKINWFFPPILCSLLLNISPWCLLSLIVSQSIQAAKTKYHSVSSLCNKHLFHTTLESGKFKMKVSAHLVLGGIRFLDCTQITSCSILTWQREHAGLSSCSYKGTNLLMGPLLS